MKLVRNVTIIAMCLTYLASCVQSGFTTAQTSVVQETATAQPTANPSFTPSPTVQPTFLPVPASPTPVPLEEFALYQLACAFRECEYSAWEADASQRYSRVAAYLSSEPGSEDSPAQSSVLSFSNYANLVAYWIAGKPSELWISDLAFHNPRRVYTDTSSMFPVGSNPGNKLTLIWSPDDKHLILDFATSSQGGPKLIYHIESGQVEDWSWDCDRVAISPLTNRLATWCPSLTQQGDYAVIEWGGDIWYNPTGPTQEIIRGSRLPLPRYIPLPNPTWVWSPDGQSIAYFDPHEADAFLHIVDATGREFTTLPGGGRDLRTIPYFVPGNLQWSQDGTRILVNAYGSEDHPCPLAPTAADGSGPLLDSFCWQVVDARTGGVLWTIKDSAAAVMASFGESADSIGTWITPDAAISPDGKLVAIKLASGAVGFGVVVNTDTGSVYSLNPAGHIMRWGERP